MKKRIAIVYDRVNKWGGAERVLLALNKIFPNAPLYTSVYNPTTARWAKVFPQVNTTFLQRLSFARSNHEYLALFMPFAFETFDFSDFDIVISVTSEAAKAIRTGPNTKHYCYCLTPTRYLWTGYQDYFDRTNLLSFFGKFFLKYLMNVDKVAAQRPDEFIAISSEVSKRIRKIYGRKSSLVYPPVDLPKIKMLSGPKKHFLIVSRLVPYKKVDLAVRVFNKLKEKLIIVGTGSEMSKLRKISRKNIKFVGQVSEDKLSEYYSKAKALVMPQNEDFGIVAVESQMFGVPVIAYGKGGALDTVIDGKTGILFEKQDEDSLVKALKRYENTNFSIKDMQLNADRFSFKNFETSILEILNK